MPSPLYDLRTAQVKLDGTPVLGPLDLRLEAGTFLGIVGPNGSGKTTLLRTLTGAVKPCAGEVLLHGKPIADYKARQLAREVGVVPQSFTLDFNFTVEETVALGRYAHGLRDSSMRTDEASVLTGAEQAALRGTTGHDPVGSALAATGLQDLSGRLITRLSGGERQRTLIAQTLAQETPTLLLDEPLNNLDLNHQLEAMQLLRELHAAGRTVVVVLHDLNMAAQYCEELVLLEQGRIAARGAPGQVLDPALILEVFKARVAVHRQGRRPYVTPVWSEPLDASRDKGRKQVHVVAGGGAATAVIEELVLAGYAPSVGIVSVFDTDYATAQSYELEVVSTPPFEPAGREALREAEALIDQAQAIIVAPMFFGRGNLTPLHAVLEAAKTGTKVLLIAEPPLADRDLSDGQAAELIAQLRAAGATDVSGPAEAARAVAAP